MNRIAKRLTKLNAIPDFDIVGYNVFRGSDVVYLLNSPDVKFKNDIMNCTVNNSERNFLVSTIKEYFVNQVQSDEEFFNATVGSCLIEHAKEPFIANGIIDEEKFKAAMYVTKKGVTNFKPNNFRSLPLSEKNAIVLDMDAFFDDMYGDTYLRNTTDVSNFCIVKEMADTLKTDETDE